MAKRMQGWHPLSAEARQLIENEPGKWDYVELWDGAAAQSVVFGVPARRPPPDLFSEPEPEKPDPDQMELEI
jgi:hypothetical protein